jgi:outer membrane receptor protein involved in Fe transport
MMRKFTTTRSALALGISAAAMAVSMTVATPAFAQATSGITGHVEGAAAGTSIIVIDTVTGQKITVKTDVQGNYRVVGIRPSTYTVAIEGSTPTTVIAPVGQTAIADLETAEAATASKSEGGKDIVIVGTRRLETRSATVSTNVSTLQMDNLPQNERNFLNFAALAPGVTVSPSGGSRQIQAGAVSGDRTNVFIDGLSMKNPVNHGGVAGQNFSKGNPFPQSAIQEFKVDTQNFKAEYEQSGSAIITAVTKTGGDEFHGGAFGEWQPKAFIGQPYFDRKANLTKPDYNRWQYGADLGGPIIKDLLHFFVAFEATDQKLPSTAVSFGAGTPASIVDQYQGTFAQSFKQRLYFGKLTLFATDRDTVNASVFIRREKNLSDYGGNSAPTHGHELTSNINVYQYDWTHRGDDWLNEFTVAYNTVSNGTPRATGGPEIVLNPNASLGGELAFLGTASFAQNDEQKTLTIKDNVTLTRDNHVFKFGVKLAQNKYDRLEDNYSNGSYNFVGSTYTGFDTSTPFAAKVSTVPVQPAHADNLQIGLFAQDDWTIGDHWTVNAGLRWDYETNAKNEKFVTPPAIAAALRAYPGWKAAGINPEDYISNGTNRKPYWKAFQPRLGVSYDVNGDRDMILFAGAGRYFDRPLFITSGIETIKSYYQSVTMLNFCDGSNIPTCASIRAANGGNLPAGTLPFNPAYKNVDNLRAAAIAAGTGGDVWLLNNDTKLPYTDQFNFGFRKRLGKIQTSVTFAYNRSENIFQFVRGNRLPNGQYTSNGNQWIEDGFPPAGQLSNFYTGKLNIGANDGKATYLAVYFTAEKPFTKESRWGFSASLTVQRARTNDAQELQSDEFYNGPNQTVYGWEYVNGVPKFNFVGTGIVRGPFDTILSGTLTLSSGPAFGSVITGLPNTPENACCYGNLGGVYFPHETFGYSNLDLRIAKNIKLPWGTDFELSFAAFNVFDTVNRNYSSWGAGGRSYDAATGTIPPATYQENGTVGNARSFQVGGKFRF